MVDLGDGDRKSLKLAWAIQNILAQSVLIVRLTQKKKKKNLPKDSVTSKINHMMKQNWP